MSRTVTILRRGAAAPATCTEAAGFTDADLATVLSAGLLPVETAAGPTSVAVTVVDAADAPGLIADGREPWRIVVRHTSSRADTLDVLSRTGVAYLRTDITRISEAVSLCSLPACETRTQIEVDDVAAAVDAIALGIDDVVVTDWDDAAVAELRDRIVPDVLVERGALPPFLDIDLARERLSRPVLKVYLDQIDASGFRRPTHGWAPGVDMAPPVPPRRLSIAYSDAAWADRPFAPPPPDLATILDRSLDGIPPTRDEVERLFRARGDEVEHIAKVADTLRERTCGDEVTYVINRNINYTNLCYFRCGFCGFSKGPKSLNLRGAPYLVPIEEVVERAVEAADRGATEVCLQGGIHPDFTGDFYVSVCQAIKDRLPSMHVHGFTALEVWQGAQTAGVSVRDLLLRLRDAGLGTLPGTAAEILDDRVRLYLCPDKIRTAEWAEVHITAHELGFRSNNTLMFGHIDSPAAWANHFEVVRQIQRRTGGFTEFVPLPFVHMGAPIYLQGRARPGPTWDEVVLAHAVGRIAFDGLIPNIQASWVKLGLDGGGRLLNAGCNDLGGTLMDENISRAAGANHGQLATPEEFQQIIRDAGRIPVQRTTTYGRLDTPAPVA